MRAPFLLMLVMLFVIAAGAAFATDEVSQQQGWPQWGQSAQHTSSVDNAAQPSTSGARAAHILAAVVYDPFTAQEQSDPLSGGGVLVHYPTPLVEGGSIFMEFKTGTYTSLATWQTQIWNEERLDWQNGSLVQTWAFQSDWKPVPYGSPSQEPVFHAALADNAVYVPGFGGSVYKLAKSNGKMLAHIQPFGPTVNPNIFASGPITVDAHGSIYFLALQLDPDNPWTVDVVNSWLVKADSAGHVSMATVAALTPGAPSGTDQCPGSFSTDQLPWPPSLDAVAPTVTCGSQRVGVNIAPAVAPDGTIYIATLAQFVGRVTYVVAVNPDLTPKWQTSLLERFNDGCNVLLPPNGTPGGCAAGTPTGIDPAVNAAGSGRILDNSTASPVVAPDGSVFFGVYTRYIYGQGHLVKISAKGEYLGAYPYGYDVTPAIFEHDGTYSVVTPDNLYGGIGSYCNVPTFCPPERTAASPVGYFVTQLSKDLVPEWRYENTNEQACSRGADNQVTCSPITGGFAWIVNAPAVDRNGVVYANSDDGNVYAINQGGTLRTNAFLDLAIGAVGTPSSIGPSGEILTVNDGTLFVIGRR